MCAARILGYSFEDRLLQRLVLCMSQWIEAYTWLQIYVGRIYKIFAILSAHTNDGGDTVVVIERYNVSDRRDRQMNMPVLTLWTDEADGITLVKPTV